MSNIYTVTVKGGLFAQYSGTLAAISGRAANEYAIRRALDKMPVLRELMLTLNGAAAGSAASVTKARVEANEELGGRRTIEVETLISRNTAAADKTRIDADILTHEQYDSTPVVNLDRNPLGTR